MSRKISFHDQNKAALEQLCAQNGYEIAWLNSYQARVISGTTIVDIWTPRMRYNVLNIDGVYQKAKYSSMPREFDKDKVGKLLLEGKL